MMINFQTDPTLQEYITIVCDEGREKELLAISDNYHYPFKSQRETVDWAFRFGEYVGENCQGQKVWRFFLNEGGAVYFIGTKEDIDRRISVIL